MENLALICETASMPEESMAERLKAWRKANGFTQSEAVAALNRLGFPVMLNTLQNWEIGRNKPNPYAAPQLDRILRGHPKITQSK
jgi:transcriptional regulator with XRE-family HTH domain